MPAADSIPGLEIEADDVRCTHGSTTGRVDDEQIFYARCRGLTRKEAVRMIVTGFFQQVFDRITIESVREALGDSHRPQNQRVRLKRRGSEIGDRIGKNTSMACTRCSNAFPDPLTPISDPLIRNV